MLPKVSQEMLAELIDTTRSQVKLFMNKFRKLGFIHYNGGLQVHTSIPCTNARQISRAALRDWPPSGFDEDLHPDPLPTRHFPTIKSSSGKKLRSKPACNCLSLQPNRRLDNELVHRKSPE
jgi:hypothetical protein